MVELLAFICVILIVRWVAKFSTSAGNWLAEMSCATADFIAALNKKVNTENITIRRQNKNAADSIRIIKGVEQDVYTNNVRKEIDLLERQVNGMEE